MKPVDDIICGTESVSWQVYAQVLLHVKNDPWRQVAAVDGFLWNQIWRQTAAPLLERLGSPGAR